MRRSLLLAAAALLATPGTAGGDGLPVGNVDVGPEGVVGASDSARIVALPAGAGSTLVARIETGSGRVKRSKWLREPLTIPGVALDGTADGLSGNERTMVVIRPREHGDFPLRRTRFLVLDARTLRVKRRITLRGDFSFDALSPDGRRMFVVNYVDRRDPRAYLVRSFDLDAGRLERGAIVDAREPDEDMRGYPVTRATTEDGRWAYTLYDGGGDEPFIHALDTAQRRAFCIDLPMVADVVDPHTMRLDLRDGLRVVDEQRKVRAIVDTTEMHADWPPRTGLFSDITLSPAAASEV
ncbi:MAG TPA: hypothetical protein VGW10_18500 [Solirubrobacteraceae bacterium]|nr:hypothetical protein [Solirubrobacteraceae bacterium]